jgi:hypothetical protein
MGAVRQMPAGLAAKEVNLWYSLALVDSTLLKDVAISMSAIPRIHRHTLGGLGTKERSSQLFVM